MYLQHPRPEYTTTVGKCIRLQGDRIGDVCKNSSEVLSETDFFLIFFLHCIACRVRRLQALNVSITCTDLEEGRGESGSQSILENHLMISTPGGGGVILVTREKILNPRLHHSKYTSLASSF